MRLRSALSALALGALALGTASVARAETAPAEIKVGDLYSTSGPYAGISMPVYYGLRLWIDQVNADGGAFVKAYNKKIPIKLVAYDDQSNPGTEATLVNQLITQDHVNLLLCDSGSVLTAPAVPIAREHKMFLFDPTGTGAPFFTPDNKYIALIADPASTIWPRYAAEFLNNEGPKLGIKTVAMIYSTNDFTGTQAAAFKKFIEAAGKLKIVYDQGVPTSTSNYTVLINNLAAKNPDAVIEMGYPGNDIAFLRNLQDAGQQFKFLFTIYSGSEPEEIMKNVGAAGMKNVFTYVPGSSFPYKVTTGMDLSQYKALWDKTYSHTPGANFGLNAVAGYTVGIVLQETLGHATSLSQEDIRNAVFGLSGNLTSLQGPFKLAPDGAQIGEITPLGQVEPNGSGGVKLNVIYPSDLANAQPAIGK
jgi:branched-chain amino acid transport system substrate-binding protein